MNNTIDKLHTLSLGALTLLQKLYMGEYGQRDYSFAPELSKAGFLKKISTEPFWEIIKGTLSIENGSAQELAELQALKHERHISEKISMGM